jgi:hypothetical protein
MSDVTFVQYQPEAVTPTSPLAKQVYGDIKEAARCPPLSATVRAGLWVYPPFDAEIECNAKGFTVHTAQGLEALAWADRMESLVGWSSSWWCSKIPGVLQIDIGYVICSAAQKLLVTAPMNVGHVTHMTQSGLVDTDFFRAPFAINLVPYPGQKKMQLRKSVPIAQLLDPFDVLRAMSFEVMTLEKRPDVLEFWKRYIVAVFGPADRQDQSGAKRVDSVYRSWRDSLAGDLGDS